MYTVYCLMNCAVAVNGVRIQLGNSRGLVVM